MAPNTYVERRNIKEEVHEAVGSMPEYTDYVCEYRYITADQYIDRLEAQTVKNQEDIEYIAMMSEIEL